MDFELSAEQKEIQALTRDFVAAEIEPHAAEWDRKHHFPRDVFAKLAELGKTPAQANDFPGFVSNRILMPFVNEAVWALHDGVAEPEAIDTIAKLGFAHPLGPLALADLIGLDTCVAIMEVIRDGLGEDRFEPCPLLREHVAAGRLGRKSGAGFYDYS